LFEIVYVDHAAPPSLLGKRQSQIWFR